MSADSNHTSRSFIPADLQIGARECAVADDANPAPARPAKPRKKRAAPPTYDDGATTRLFKFPSRAYPKSSYYITSTEVIIRIKKARKKWKLVLPKKRVVSYRTNRWFAKPRWVEIELTYTQALKHGLVEPSTASAAPVPSPTVVVGDPVGELAPVATDQSATSDVMGEAPVPEAADEGVAFAACEVEVTPIVVAAAVPDADVRFCAGPLRPLQAEELPPMPAAGESMAEIILPATLAIDGSTTPAGDGERHRTSNRYVRMGVLVSALVLLTGGGTWWLMTDVVTDSRPSSHQTSVAGTMAPVGVIRLPTAGGPRVVEPPVQETSEPLSAQGAQTEVTTTTTASPRDEGAAVATAQQELQTTHGMLETVGELAGPAVPIEVQPAGPEPMEVARAEVRRIEPVNEVPSAAVERRPQHESASSQPADHAAAASCRHRIATAIDGVSFQFGYASAVLHQPSFEMLDRSAVLLRSCPGVVVTIAGHTDADGHFDRNQSLSMRRAEAVRQFLINGGIEPRQLSVIGLGQMRPLAPNDTESNKRRNRRVELVLQ